MGDAITDKLRLAAEGLVLNDAQKHILAYRLTRRLKKQTLGRISVSEMLGMIETAMHDMTSGVEVFEVPEDSYRDSRVLGGAQPAEAVGL